MKIKSQNIKNLTKKLPHPFAGPHANPRRIRTLENRLSKEYGPVKIRRLDPLDELILTILSQNTNDNNRDKAYSALRKQFPTHEDILNAPLEDIENAIRPGGLAANKSRTIKGLLQRLKQTRGKLSLDYLGSMSTEDALHELTSFPGVGLKTASVVLLFCFSRPIMPVDTHVHRLSRRLGLASPKANPTQTAQILSAVTPKELILPFHLHLIAHGKSICKSQKPACSICTIADLCPSAQ